MNLLQYPSLASQGQEVLRITHLIQYPSLASISGDRRLRDCKPLIHYPSVETLYETESLFMYKLHSLSCYRNAQWIQKRGDLLITNLIHFPSLESLYGDRIQETLLLITNLIHYASIEDTSVEIGNLFIRNLIHYPSIESLLCLE